MRSMSYQRKVGDFFFPQLLVISPYLRHCLAIDLVNFAGYNSIYTYHWGRAVVELVEALCCKPEGRRFDS
jgi:hypothetical protein